jgi:hypothetical protein
MIAMSRTGYRLLGYLVSRGARWHVGARGQMLLGYVVWHGGRRYLHRRMPRHRVIALSGLLAFAALAAARAGIVRRASG